MVVEVKSIEYREGYLAGVEATMWDCGDCGNRYEALVEHCPNEVMDQAQAWLRQARYHEENSL